AIRDLLKHRGLKRRPHLLVASGRVLGTGEAALAALLLVSSGTLAVWAAAASAGLFSAFVVVIALAVRRKASCGCWGAFSSRAAAGTELVRSILMAVLALALAALRVGGADARRYDLAAVLSFAAAAGATVAVARFGVRARATGMRPTRVVPRWQRVVGWVLGSQAGRAEATDFAVPAGPFERRRVLARLEGAADVLAMCDVLGPSLDWRRALVTVRSESAQRTWFVAVSGDGVDLRILVLPSGVLSLTGRKGRDMYAGGNGQPVRPLAPPRPQAPAPSA
ncbi:MAG TPA: MauE/DoxX family redox-associated membrane protein, partial [Acidimicrobiales bacterium]